MPIATSTAVHSTNMNRITAEMVAYRFFSGLHHPRYGSLKDATRDKQHKQQPTPSVLDAPSALAATPSQSSDCQHCAVVSESTEFEHEVPKSLSDPNVAAAAARYLCSEKLTTL